MKSRFSVEGRTVAALNKAVIFSTPSVPVLWRGVAKNGVCSCANILTPRLGFKDESRYGNRASQLS